MSRTKLARRFEPRYGVSQTMLDAECRYVARELEDHVLLSTNELRSKLTDSERRIELVEQELRRQLDEAPQRERLALRCMLARDLWHVAMLYRTFLGSRQGSSTPMVSLPPTPPDAGATTAPTSEDDAAELPKPVELSFKDTLFGD